MYVFNVINSNLAVPQITSFLLITGTCLREERTLVTGMVNLLSQYACSHVLDGNAVILMCEYDHL